MSPGIDVTPACLFFADPACAHRGRIAGDGMTGSLGFEETMRVLTAAEMAPADDH